ncbi:MAG: HAMP domain-containing sensor histidine kinase [Chloroflexota bacterium]|nr:HAMP domain-containing sensor histidine kinase [Chloroflexota bacterium]
MTSDALKQAQAQVRELIEAARKGAIIPVRLAGQLEEIDKLLDAADAPAPAASASGGEVTDKAALMKEQAYFISHAVHELRTPMTSIRGYADMLVNPAMGTLTDMQKGFMETIRTNAGRMNGLLTDVSDIAKLRGGTLKVNEKMDMYKNIAMMVEKAMEPLVAQTERTLTFETPSGLPILNTDGELLAKAIGKLTENALRYNDKTPGTVTVKARGEAGKLIVDVVDDGIGITPEDKARLGELYFRSENELVRTYKGSGIGIPVAYGIIALLGGTVSVQSEVGTGTTFTVTMPGMG